MAIQGKDVVGPKDGGLLKILVIDDDPNIAKMLIISARRRWPDVSVLAALSGQRGIEMARLQGPEVVVLDLGLPDMHGVEVCRRIRQFSQVPILVLTGQVDDSYRDRVLGEGANGFMTKPFSHAELLDRLEQLAHPP